MFTNTHTLEALRFDSPLPSTNMNSANLRPDPSGEKKLTRIHRKKSRITGTSMPNEEIGAPTDAISAGKTKKWHVYCYVNLVPK